MRVRQSVGAFTGFLTPPVPPINKRNSQPSYRKAENFFFPERQYPPQENTVYTPTGWEAPGARADEQLSRAAKRRPALVTGLGAICRAKGRQPYRPPGSRRPGLLSRATGGRVDARSCVDGEPEAPIYA